MAYRDVTVLLAIDEKFECPATVTEAVSSITSGNITIVGDEETAIQVLVELGVERSYAELQVAWASGAPGPIRSDSGE